MTTTYGRLPQQSLIAGQFPSGSGGSIDNFVQENNADFDLGMSIIHRQGADYRPQGSGTSDGNVYEVASGPQPGNPTRAEFNNNFDLSTPDTLQHFLLSNDVLLNYHMEGFADVKLHAVYDPAHATGGSPVVFEDAHNNIVINDNGGNSHILANSEQYNFFNHQYHFGPGELTIDFAVVQHGGHVLADIHDTVIIGSPSPGHDAHF